jgi:hypothetical protein
MMRIHIQCDVHIPSSHNLGRTYARNFVADVYNRLGQRLVLDRHCLLPCIEEQPHYSPGYRPGTHTFHLTQPLLYDLRQLPRIS